MRSDYEPIIFDTDKAFSEIEVYCLHDLHKGNEMFLEDQWEKVKAEILSRPNRFCVFVGDAMENAVPGSKSDVFAQVVPPHLQQEWFAQQLTELAERTIAVVDGNHERNRSSRNCDMFPLYTCAALAGIQDRYRPHFAFCDVGVGTRAKDRGQQVRYVLYLVHKAKEGKGANTGMALEGVSAVICGHTHSPQDIPRAKLVYNPINKNITLRNIEVLNGGSWLAYGNYAADNAYLPSSTKKYKLLLHGDDKKIETIGFYV